MSPHLEYVLILIGCGVAVFGGGILAGCMVGPWRLIHWAHLARFDDYADRDYEEGWDDARSAARSDFAAPDCDLPLHSGERQNRDLVQLPRAVDVGRDSPFSDRSSYALDVAGSAGGVRELASGWRAEMTEQLAPAALDAANLPGPALGPLTEPGTGPERRTGRAGIHRRAIVDLGQPGDDKMLTRDWFNRRAFIESLSNEWGGFEITEHGHLVAVAA
jgi:hypothetical protein